MPKKMWVCPHCGLCNEHHHLHCEACFRLDPDRNGLPAFREKLEKYGQSHLLAFASQITDDEFESLIDQINSIDMQEIKSLWEQVLKQREECALLSSEEKSDGSTEDVSGFPKERQYTIETVEENRDSWTEAGYKGIINGECAVIIMAGGQGTRLGAKLPKGMVNLGLASKKTLLQLHCEKIRKVQQMAYDYFTQHKRDYSLLKQQSDVVLPLYIMTSTDTYYPTLNYLKTYRYFGLRKENVYLFKQREYPLLNSENGKIMLKSWYQIQFGPNGNGGLYSSLISTPDSDDDRFSFSIGSSSKMSIMDNMKMRGVKQIQVLGVDNVLAKIGDPCWFGHCLSSNLYISNKCAIKRDPFEKVGVMCLRFSKYPHVIEYSEMKSDMMKSNPELQCANLCMHSFSLEFLSKIMSDDQFKLPIHEALKNMSIVVNYDHSEYDKDFVPPVIDTRKILKMEHFIFDSFEFINDLKQFSVYNIIRNDEFAPVKNKNGKDSPYTARKSLTSLWSEKLMAAGVQIDNYTSHIFPTDPDLLNTRTINDDTGTDCEVSPLVSYCGEGLEWLRDEVISLPFKVEMVRGKPSVIQLKE